MVLSLDDYSTGQSFRLLYRRTVIPSRHRRDWLGGSRDRGEQSWNVVYQRWIRTGTVSRDQNPRNSVEKIKRSRRFMISSTDAETNLAREGMGYRRYFRIDENWERRKKKENSGKERPEYEFTRTRDERWLIRFCLDSD